MRRAGWIAAAIVGGVCVEQRGFLRRLRRLKDGWCSQSTNTRRFATARALSVRRCRTCLSTARLRGSSTTCTSTAKRSRAAAS